MRCDNLAVTRLTGAGDETSALAALMRMAWPTFYGNEGRGDAEASLRRRAEGEALPFGWVARLGKPVGTIGLSTTSFGAASDEAPWVIGLVVDPAERGRGIGSALVEAAERGARQAGFDRIYVTTQRAAPLFARRDWKALREVTDDAGVSWAVMALAL